MTVWKSWEEEGNVFYFTSKLSDKTTALYFSEPLLPVGEQQTCPQCLPN